MIGTLRKHNVWIWWIIIAATIIGFVSYLSPNRQYGGGGGGSGATADLGSINGEPISQIDFAEAQREGRLFFRFRTGQWPDTADKMRQVDSYAYQRLFLVSELKQMNIEVPPEAAAQVTRVMLNVPADQPFPADKFKEFVVSDIQAKGGLTLEDFDRYVRHEAGQQLLMSLFGMSGKLITAKEAEFFYRREHEPAVVEVATFLTSNYLAKVTATPQEIQDYYAKREAEYRLPERIQLYVVKFQATNYYAAADKALGGVTNLDERVDQAYLQAGAEAFTNEAGKPLPPAEAKAQIKKEFRTGTAVREAHKAANDFISQLADGHDKDHPITKADLDKKAKASNLEVETTPPFDQKQPPPGLKVPARQLRMAFNLQPGAPDDQFTILVGEDTVYLIGLAKRLPSEIQPLEVVRDRVTEDLRESKAEEMVKSVGESFDQAVNIGMSSGIDFDAVCAARKIKPIAPPPFSLATQSIPEMPDQTLFEHIQSTIYNVPTGKASRFVEAMDGGFVVYVKARLPVDEEAMKKELPVYLARMREQRQQAAYSEWFGKQFQTRVMIPQAERTRLNGATS